MPRLTLEDRIEVLRKDLTLSQNPKSHLRNSRAMGLLLAAKELWTMPGRQATALLLEEESNAILRNTHLDF